MAEIKDKKITQEEADRMQAPIELDFISVFKVAEEDVLKTTEDFYGTPEQLITEIIGKFEIGV